MKTNNLTNFTSVIISELRAENRFSTAHIYHHALQAFSDFSKRKQLSWSDLNRSSLKKFQSHMNQQQKSYNTISTYLRALRAIYNRAVDCKAVAGEYRLFANLNTGVASQRKLALTASQTKQLLTVKQPAGKFSHSIRRTQDELRLMILLQGMPYTDLAHLRKADLKGNFLTCRRQKTRTELCVYLMPEALKLIEKYRNLDADSPYLLNILTGKKQGEQEYIEYTAKLRTTNHNLAQLAKLAGMQNVKVSSYTARHTWATMAKYCEVPEEIISEGLGHSTMDVTRTYLKSFETEELSKANVIVNNYIKTGVKTVWNGGKRAVTS